jgi:hypothetical protein
MNDDSLFVKPPFDQAAEQSKALRYAALHGLALFACEYGNKSPHGVVKYWAEDWSTDPAQWETWRQTHGRVNFAIPAGPSCVIIVDVDEVKNPGAWDRYAEICLNVWKLDHVPAPQVRSASGSFHVYFRIAPGHDLHQPSLAKGIDIRAGNGFTIFPGSYFGDKRTRHDDGTLVFPSDPDLSGPYLLLNEEPPYPCPPELLEHCTRKVGRPVEVAQDLDVNEAAKLVQWMTERDLFDSYESWIEVGMALKLSFGDAGLPLWRLTYQEDRQWNTMHPNGDGTWTYLNEGYKWTSFEYQARDNESVTLNSIFKKAHDAGWTGQVRPSLESMFGLGKKKEEKMDPVKQMAETAGAMLTSGAPGPDGNPLMGTAIKLARFCSPYLESFNTLTADVPVTVTTGPRVTYDAHPLCEPVNAMIPRLLSWATNSPKAFHKQTAYQMLAIIAMVQEQTARDVYAELVIAGVKLKSFISIKRGEITGLNSDFRYALEIEHGLDWTRDSRGNINASNPDNHRKLYEQIELEIRFNGWLERVEVKGFNWPNWTPWTKEVEVQIIARAGRTGTEFEIPETKLRNFALDLALKNSVDPALDYFAACEAEWDGVPRLDMWLPTACHVEDDADGYHRMVGRNLIGSMVRRVREPGCQHDEVTVFVSTKQGFNKSTIGRVLVPEVKWFSDGIKLGDDSKELVLLLAGKMLAEVSEMGTRGQIEDTKAMISKRTDYGRPAYAPNPKERERRNIFIGSTNHRRFLIDGTGNRRFLPVVLSKAIDLKFIEKWKRQLIAEAAHLHSNGEQFRVPEHMWAITARYQEDSRAHGTDEMIVADMLIPEIPTDLGMDLFVHFAPKENNAPVFIRGASLERLLKKNGVNSNANREPMMNMFGFHYKKRNDGAFWIRGVDAAEFSPKTTNASELIVDDNGKVTVRNPLAPPGPQPAMPPKRT